MLGCGAHVTDLRRTMAGPFGEADLVTFEALREADAEHRLDGLLQPVSSTVRQWPAVTLTDHTAYYLRQGQPVIVPHAPTAGWVRLCEVSARCQPGGADGETGGQGTSSGGRFLGVGEILDDGRVAPRRLIPDRS